MIARGFVAAGLAGIAVYAVTDEPWTKAAIAVTLTFGALVAVVAGIRLHRPARPLPWLLLAASQAVFLAGWVLWERGILENGVPPTSFSSADAAILASYPLVATALVLLQRSREPGRGGGIEVALLTVVGALLSWILLVGPYLTDESVPGELRLTQGLYAVLDLVLLATLARALVGAPRGTSHLLLLGALCSQLAADTAWNWLAIGGSYSAGTYSDLGWLGFSLLVGAAALHPSSRAAGLPVAAAPRGLDRRRVAVLVLGALVLPAATIWEHSAAGKHDRFDSPVALGAFVALALLVVARMLTLLRESERLRARLAEQNERLQEVDRLKDDFVASVSHELRTPLTSIRGYLELMRDGEAGELTEEQASFLEIVDRNADRLLRVVGDLLLVAQIDAGALPLERGDVDPAALARQAAAAARPTAERRGIRLDLDLGRLPDALPGDHARLAQALDNLVSNAVKFTPAGGTVGVRAGAVNGSVELEVSDTGPGIAPQDRERLFERFFRTREATRQAVPGTGLGLAITRAIVEAHGGTITVESDVGRGSAFRIRLPARAA